MKLADRERARKITAEEYGRVARLWDRYWVPAYSPARERLFHLARLKQGENVLDVGTGTGATAVVAADLVGKRGKVLAVDNSRGMLTVARLKARKMGLTNIKFRLAGLASLQLPRESFDAVISSYGMPDLASDDKLALLFLFKVLRSGGRLCFCEKAEQPEEPEAMIREILQRFKVAKANSELKAGRRIEVLMKEEGEQFHFLYHTNTSTIRDAVEIAGFTNVQVFREIFRVKFPDTWTYLKIELSSWFHEEYAAMPSEVRREFREEVLKTLNRFKTLRGLTWRVGVNFCSAQK